METFNKTGGSMMEKYKKPCLVTQGAINGIIPLAAIGAAVAGLSSAQLAGAATAAGLAYGMATAKGSNDIVSFRSRLILQD